MTIEQLVTELNNGQHSLAIYDAKGNLHTYQNRGVKDLYHLLAHEPHVLKGALVADKVVGKGAAALMIMGGIAQLHTHTISLPAKTLLDQAGIIYTYDAETDHIENRNKDGWCPVENLCHNAPSAADCVPLIANFIESMRK